MDEQCSISRGISCSIRLVDPFCLISPLTCRTMESAELGGKGRVARARPTAIEARLVPEQQIVRILDLLSLDEATDGAVEAQRGLARGLRSAEEERSLTTRCPSPWQRTRGGPFS